MNKQISLHERTLLVSNICKRKPVKIERFQTDTELLSQSIMNGFQNFFSLIAVGMFVTALIMLCMGLNPMEIAQ